MDYNIWVTTSPVYMAWLVEPPTTAAPRNSSHRQDHPGLSYRAPGALCPCLGHSDMTCSYKKDTYGDVCIMYTVYTHIYIYNRFIYIYIYTYVYMGLCESRVFHIPMAIFGYPNL